MKQGRRAGVYVVSRLMYRGKIDGNQTIASAKCNVGGLLVVGLRKLCKIGLFWKWLHYYIVRIGTSSRRKIDRQGCPEKVSNRLYQKQTSVCHIANFVILPLFALI